MKIKPSLEEKFYLPENRAFVNDSPVNLQELQELGAMLLDIHSQHQTRELTEENYQLIF